MKRSLSKIPGAVWAYSWVSGSQNMFISGSKLSSAGAPSSSVLNSSSSSLAGCSFLPSTQALAAAGCCGLALRLGLRSLILDALAGHSAGGSRETEDAGSKTLISGNGAANSSRTGSGGGAPPLRPLQPSSPAALLASLGLGLGTAAAAPAGIMLANLTPNWDRLDRRWRDNKWNLFGRGRRVTEILMALNVGVYGLQQIYPSLVFKLARVNYLVSQGEVWRLLTAALVHGSFFHLAINTLSLYLIGPAVEEILGRKRFAIAYAASAVAGNTLAWAMGSSGFVMSVGASSSVSGLFGAYIMFRWLNRRHYGIAGSDMSWLAQVVGINMLIQLGSHSVDGWSHLGGALGGAAVVALMGPRPGRW